MGVCSVQKIRLIGKKYKRIFFYFIKWILLTFLYNVNGKKKRNFLVFIIMLFCLSLVGACCKVK